MGIYLVSQGLCRWHPSLTAQWTFNMCIAVVRARSGHRPHPTPWERGRWAGRRGLTQGTRTHSVTPPSQPGSSSTWTEAGFILQSCVAREHSFASQHQDPTSSATSTCHCFPPVPSCSLSILQHCVLLHIPSLPSLPFSLLLALPTLCIRGFYEPSCIPTPPLLLQLVAAGCAM